MLIAFVSENSIYENIYCSVLQIIILLCSATLYCVVTTLMATLLHSHPRCLNLERLVRPWCNGCDSYTFESNIIRFRDGNSDGNGSGTCVTETCTSVRKRRMGSSVRILLGVARDRMIPGSYSHILEPT